MQDTLTFLQKSYFHLKALNITSILAFDDDFSDLDGDDSDQVATKLDLALAYMDMGDSEGAKDILVEVIDEGTPEQQKQARDLMKDL